MSILRRFLVLVLLMFWQGGFTFYTAVVVPIGADVLGGAEKQGWITRRVTVFLNLAGVGAVAALGWDVAVDPLRRRRRVRWIVVCLLAATLLVLIWLHLRLDARMDAEQQLILDHPGFLILHRWYLWVSTFQWACGVAALFLMLQAWAGEESLLRRGPPRW